MKVVGELQCKLQCGIVFDIVVEKHLPHIGQMMRAEIADVIAESEVLVIGLSGQEVADKLVSLVRPDQLLLDLVNLPNRESIRAQVEGVCW